MSVDGAAPIAGTPRYGSQIFDHYCTADWNATQPFGRLCIEGTTAPFYSGFHDPYADACTDSSSVFSAVSCSAARQFSIAVR